MSINLGVFTMIAGYEDFKENREEARLVFRAAIARQTLDTSDRGRSVRMALRNMYVASCDFNARDAWALAYQQQRVRDRNMRDMVQRSLLGSLPGMLAALTSPRKIDELLGRT